MPSTGFRPSTHGFHFSNNDIRWSYLTQSGRKLCGGMTYASLDYYYHRVAVPPVTSPPQQGTPLHSFIYMRQEDAHRYALPLLSRTMPERGNRAFSDAVRSGGQFGRVMRSIDAQRPIPLLMVSSRSALSTGSHWTLAIGYEKSNHASFGPDTCSKIYLYDNAVPNQICELVPEFMRGMFRHTPSNVLYRTIFANDRYTAVHPNSAARTPSASDLVPAILGGVAPGPGTSF